MQKSCRQNNVTAASSERGYNETSLRASVMTDHYKRTRTRSRTTMFSFHTTIQPAAINSRSVGLTSRWQARGCAFGQHELFRNGLTRFNTPVVLLLLILCY